MADFESPPSVLLEMSRVLKRKAMKMASKTPVGLHEDADTEGAFDIRS